MQNLVTQDTLITSKIYTIRGKQVMLDRDLADLYGVSTKVFNQAVKRNIQRFPDDFRFQLSEDEFINWRSQFVTSSHGGIRYFPYAFTEQGVSMLSSVLKSDIAIEMSITIIKLFVQMKHTLSSDILMTKRLELLEMKQEETSKDVSKILNAMEEKSLSPKEGIFYDGEVFDAYLFISKLIKSAQKSIVLFDNYVDETTLALFSKNQKVKVKIYTQTISKTLKVDVEKYNTQYLPLEVYTFKKSHDRFIILDENEVYHIGASLKDLGKKWFAFSKMDINSLSILDKVQK
jgi:hypothetical protein